MYRLEDNLWSCWFPYFTMLALGIDSGPRVLQQAPLPTEHPTGSHFFLSYLLFTARNTLSSHLISAKPCCLFWWLCPPDCNSDICLLPGFNSISMAIRELISMVAPLNFISGQQSAANIVFPRISEFRSQHCDKGRALWPL